MIVVENRFEEIFNLLPPMINPSDSTNTEYKPKYSFGDDKELMQYIILNKSKVYPLIWLVTPFQEEHKLKKVNLNSVSLILAVKSNGDFLNKQRFETTYKNVLFPFYDNVIEVLRKVNIVNLSEEIKITKFPNYSNEVKPGNRESLKSSEKHKTFDIWDAIKITINCSINGSCIKPVKFRSNVVYNSVVLGVDINSEKLNGWIYIEKCYVSKNEINKDNNIIQSGDVVYYKEVIHNGNVVSLVGWEYNAGDKLLIESYNKIKNIA